MRTPDPHEQHLLVVDDDPRLRELLRRFLVREGYHISAAEDAAAAKALLERFTFDLMVLDVMMPGQDGFSLVRELRGRAFELPILLLTARAEVEDRIEGLKAGSDDYLVKPFEPRELSLRIASILRRSRAEQAGAARGPVRFGPFAFDTVRRELRRGGALQRLTAGEAAMLHALAERAGGPLTRAELATAGGVVGSDRAVDTQMARLRRKIEDDPRQPRHLLTLRGEGYALRIEG